MLTAPPLSSFRPLVVSLVATLFAAGAQPAVAACTCTAMTVKTSGLSQEYCVDTATKLEECAPGTKTCPIGQKSVQCPLGKTSGKGRGATDYYMGYGFEVTSTITGNVDECNNGQGLQRSITTDGTKVSPGKISYKVPLAGTYTINDGGSGHYTATLDGDMRKNWPNIGSTSGGNPLYGSDSYSTSSSTQTTIASTATSIYWADLPSIYFDDADLGKTVKLDDQAFTFVLNSGSGPTKPMSGPGCACAVHYTTTKAPMTSWSVTNLAAAVSGANKTVATVSCGVIP